MPLLQWSKEFLEAGKRRLAGDTARTATTDEVKELRTAGLGNGMRVLDSGSSAGDVAMLAARLVGREGEVVGVERDPEAVASATARVTQAGLDQCSVHTGRAQKLDGVADGFDAPVERLVLMYFSDPAAALVVPLGWCDPVAWFAVTKATWLTTGLLQ
jgi:ubiquinone/menaquinone biosynthesis C-methylase UbiE